jgi:flagella basal body P-ring formation protein FlgA
MLTRHAILLLALPLQLLASAAAAEQMDLPVPLETVRVGEAVAASKFTRKTFFVNNIARQNFVTIAAQLENMEARSTLAPGRPVALKQLRRIPVVRKGAQISAVYETSGIQITATLQALEDGLPGDIITAKNLMTGQVLHAPVSADGTLHFDNAKP